MVNVGACIIGGFSMLWPKSAHCKPILHTGWLGGGPGARIPGPDFFPGCRMVRLVSARPLKPLNGPLGSLAGIRASAPGLLCLCLSTRWPEAPHGLLVLRPDTQGPRGQERLAGSPMPTWCERSLLPACGLQTTGSLGGLLVSQSRGCLAWWPREGLSCRGQSFQAF